MKYLRTIWVCLCCIIAAILSMQIEFSIQAGESEQQNENKFLVSCEETQNKTMLAVPLYDITITITSEQKDFDGVIQIEVINQNRQSVVYEKALLLKQGEEQTIDFSCVFHDGNINYNVYAVEKKSRDIVYKQTVQKVVKAEETEWMQQIDMGMSGETLKNMPPTWTFFLTFLFYFIIVGPVLYVILKKIEHRTWIWFLLPCIAITVTIGIYIATAKTRVTKPVIRAFHLMDIQQDQTYVEQTEFHLLVPSNKKYHMNYKSQYDIYCNELNGEAKKMNNNSLYNIKIRYNEKGNTMYLKNLAALSEIAFCGQTKGTSKLHFFVKDKKIYNDTNYNFTFLFGKKKDQYYLYAPLKSGEHRLQTGYEYCTTDEALYEMIVQFMKKHVISWEQQRQYEYMIYLIQQKEMNEDYLVGITSEYQQNIFDENQANETGVTAIRIPLSDSFSPANDSREEKENVAN